MLGVVGRVAEAPIRGQSGHGDGIHPAGHLLRRHLPRQHPGGIVAHFADDVRPVLQRQHLVRDECGDKTRPLEPLPRYHHLDLVTHILQSLWQVLGHVAPILLGERLLIRLQPVCNF